MSTFKNNLTYGFLVMVMVLSGAVWAQETKPVAPEPQTPPVAEKEDENRVIAQVGDASLTAWQANVMMAHGAARDLPSAARFWIDIQLKMEEVKRRHLDQKKENAFIADLFKQHYLSMKILDEALREGLPEPSDDEAQKVYEENPDRYKRPFQAEIQHIQITDQTKTQEIYQLAQGDTPFDQLVEQYSQAPDKNRKGMIKGSLRVLERQVGQKASQAIEKARAGEIIGPFISAKGFEIIKIVGITPEGIEPFDNVKGQIKQQLQQQHFAELQEKIKKDLEAQIPVVKPAELIEMEQKEAQLQAEQKKQAEQQQTKQPDQPAPSAPAPTPSPAPAPGN